jgi:hypothetical protein
MSKGRKFNYKKRPNAPLKRSHAINTEKDVSLGIFPFRKYKFVEVLQSSLLYIYVRRTMLRFC